MLPDTCRMSRRLKQFSRGVLLFNPILPNRPIFVIARNSAMDSHAVLIRGDFQGATSFSCGGFYIFLFFVCFVCFVDERI